MRIIAHSPFAGINNAVSNNNDILSTTNVFDVLENRITVDKTDDGKDIRSKIDGLTMLLSAYRNGYLKENKTYAKNSKLLI